MNDLRVLIVADGPLVRAGLAGLMAEQPGCLVVGQVPSESAEADTLDAYRPDVLLWDLGWEPQTSLEKLSEPAAPQPLLVLLNDPVHAGGAWAAGARGLLPRWPAPILCTTQSERIGSLTSRGPGSSRGFLKQARSAAAA